MRLEEENKMHAWNLIIIFERGIPGESPSIFLFSPSVSSSSSSIISLHVVVHPMMN